MRKMLILSISFSRILRVLCASTMVGLPRVCLRLLIIYMFLFLASWKVLDCPGFIM